MLVSLSLAGKPPRLSKEAFLKLSKKGKNAYLTSYPRSTHRFLIQDKVKTVVKKNVPNPTGKKPEKKKLRRLTRDEYNALSEKHKSEYDDHFPKNSHRKRFKSSQRTKPAKTMDGRESKKDASKRRKELSDKVDKQRNVIHDDGAGVINRESVKALALIQPHHLSQGAANIESNRGEIHDLVTQQLADKPEVTQRGLAALRDMMQGGLLDEKDVTPKRENDTTDEADDDIIEGEFEEIEEQKNEKPASKFSDAHWKEFNKDKGKFKKRFGDNKPYVNEDGEKEYYDDGDEITVGDMRQMRYDEMKQERAGTRKKPKNKKRAHKDGKKQRDGHSVAKLIIKTALLGAGIGLLAMGAGPLALVISRGLLDLWGDMGSLSGTAGLIKMEDEDSNTVDELITQTISYMRNFDTVDLREQSTEMYTALSAFWHSPKKDVDVYNIVHTAVMPFNNGRSSGRVSKNFFGRTTVDMDTLANAIAKTLKEAGVLKEHERYSDEIDKSHMFFCNDSKRTLVALGMFEQSHLYHVAFLNW